MWCASFFLTSCLRPARHLPPDNASCSCLPSYSFAMSTEVSHSLAAAMSRPQIGIDRLPARRVSNEPREAMNCKSCRKRKVLFRRRICHCRRLLTRRPDQVQSHTADVRGLPGVQLPVYLWYAPLSSPNLGACSRELTSRCRCRTQEARTQNRRPRSPPEACRRPRKAPGLRRKERRPHRSRPLFSTGCHPRLQTHRCSNLALALSAPNLAKPHQCYQPCEPADVARRAKVPIHAPTL